MTKEEHSFYIWLRCRSFDYEDVPLTPGAVDLALEMLERLAVMEHHMEKWLPDVVDPALYEEEPYEERR